MFSYKYCNELNITSSCYLACISHAMTTDTEEIMGLLLGTESLDNIGNIKIEIISCVSLMRNCKEKDRVEFDDIQISQAVIYADELSNKHRIKLKVVGWYHSHPKITVPPSHVDLNTQLTQQSLGSFVGLIFSVFTKEQNSQKFESIAFQTKITKEGQNIPYYLTINIIEDISLKIFDFNLYTNKIVEKLLNEEEIEFEKFKNLYNTGNNDKILESNDVILMNNRQILFLKIIEVLLNPRLTFLEDEKDYEKIMINYYKKANDIIVKKIEVLKKILSDKKKLQVD